MDQNKSLTLHCNGVDLPYVEQGDGVVVVLVHGSNSDQRIWDRQRAILASRYRVIALTQRYFGSGAWPDAGQNFSMTTHANDLAAFITNLRVGPVTLVGWSYGGGVSLATAVRNRALVKRMFLFEPSLATFVTAPEDAKAAAADRTAMMSAAKPLAAAGDLSGAVRTFMDDVNAEAGAFEALSADVRAMMIENARMLPLLFAGPAPPLVTEADLRALDVPILIALGEQSRAAYQIAARTAAALLPNSRLSIVGGAKHLWPTQDPEAFSRMVLNFLSDTQSLQ